MSLSYSAIVIVCVVGAMGVLVLAIGVSQLAQKKSSDPIIDGAARHSTAIQPGLAPWAQLSHSQREAMQRSRNINMATAELSARQAKDEEKFANRLKEGLRSTRAYEWSSGSPSNESVKTLHDNQNDDARRLARQSVVRANYLLTSLSVLTIRRTFSCQNNTNIIIVITILELPWQRGKTSTDMSMIQE